MRAVVFYNKGIPNLAIECLQINVHQYYLYIYIYIFFFFKMSWHVCSTGYQG